MCEVGGDSSKINERWFVDEDEKGHGNKVVDSVLNYPLYYAVRGALIDDTKPILGESRKRSEKTPSGFKRLQKLLKQQHPNPEKEQGDNAAQGWSVAGNFLENHDHTRFLSELDTKMGITHHANDPQFEQLWKNQTRRYEAWAHARLLSGLALTYVWPGVPIMYYGGEAGWRNASRNDSSDGSYRADYFKTL